MPPVTSSGSFGEAPRFQALSASVCHPLATNYE